jgi:outer membrane protein
MTVRALLLLLIAAPALAQTPMTRVGFDDAVKRAVERNPAIAQAATAIARAEALLQQARAVMRPTISATMTNTTLDSARGFSGGVTQPQDQVTFSGDVTMPVLAASRWAALAQNRDQIEIARLSVTETRQQIAIATAQAYLAVLSGHRQVEVDARALEAARAHLDYAQKRLDAGGGSRLNQLRAAQAVASDETHLENTRLALRRSQEALGVLIVEPGPVDADGEPSFDVPATISESDWREARPDVQFQQAVIRAAERVVRDTWKDWLPNASATFAPQLVAPSGLFQPSRTWRLTVSLTQPIFEGGQRKAVMALRGITVDQSKLALTEIEIRARSEIRLAQESLASNERALASARLASDHANEVLRITTSAFGVGATTNIEVIDAQRSARDAESVATVGEDLVRRAKLDLLVALGRFPR